MKTYMCEIKLIRKVKADSVDEAKAKFWINLDYEFNHNNTTLENELSDSMKLSEDK